MSVDYRAAWVPFDQDNGQIPAALTLAVAWVEQECADQGRGVGLLITPKKDCRIFLMIRGPRYGSALRAL